MKYKVVCNGISMRMSREESDIYYEKDGYLIFDGGSGATEFSSMLAATRAVELSIVHAMKYGYETWGIFKGYSVVPYGE